MKSDKIFSFFIPIGHLFYLWQTLTTLNLARNQIGVAGAQAIALSLAGIQVR